jgi:16S rRNA (adenine1518-N6/adenine1519-N6)-dimethyltransferase
MNINDIKILMKSLDLKPKKKLGQVFLVDEDVILNQIDFASLTKSDTVLEIGPGLGVLTKRLAELAGKVIAIEYDVNLYDYLKKTMPENVELICDDAIKVEFPKFNKIVANIPYQISSPLIFKLVDYQFELGIMMLQTEFANRLLAKPKSEVKSKKTIKQYSRLSVMASYYYEIIFLKYVSRTSFLPVPEVDSTIVQLTPKLNPIRPVNEQLFHDLVRILFSKRRKMIKNAIASQLYAFDPKLKKISKTAIKELINCLPNTETRPEELTLEDFIKLSDALHYAIKDV